MRLPTGSKLPLAFACPASIALPWIDAPVGAPALRGTMIHEFRENLANLGRDTALDLAPPEARPFLQAIDLDRFAHDLMPEASFAIDWRARTARFLGTGLGRAYPPGSPTEIFLTTDMLGVAPAVVYVDDLKTGATRYPAPSAFEQTMAAARAATWAFERDDAMVGLVTVDEHGEVFPRVDAVNGWELDDFADRLAETLDRVVIANEIVARGGTPDVRPGPHCRGLYCPAYRACPNTSALVRHMPEHVGEVQRPGYLAPTRLARTWHQVKALKAALGVVEQEVRNLAMAEPIDLGDGTELSARTYETETFDAFTARAVIDELVAPGLGDRAVKMKVPKNAIEEVAKEWRNGLPDGKGPDGKRVVLESKKGTGLLDRIHATIRERGGATVEEKTTVSVRKRKEQLP